jgi:prophage antirepressor-like protein
VCDALGLDTSNHSKVLDDDEKGLYNIQTPDGLQKMVIINEPGLYSLIFRSRKQKAKDFKRWIIYKFIFFS